MNFVMTRSPKSWLSGRSQKTDRRGFTIIELMIATLVFSVILLVVTSGILEFTRQYYRGVTATTTQGTARTIVDDIGRALQFNKGGFAELRLNPSDAQPSGFCVGNSKRYSFIVGKQIKDDDVLGSNQVRHALVSDDVENCNAGTPPLNVAALDNRPLPTQLSGIVNARELLAEHMRVVEFSVEASAIDSNTYNIKLKIIYGDDDLLCSPSTPGSCAPDGALPNPLPLDITCKSAPGSQFCAPSVLATTINNRVQ